MAERRRIIPASVGPDFNESREQPERPTRRFTVALRESSEKTSPEFSYIDLVKEAGGVIEEHKSFNDLEEDDLTGLTALARKFEEKYGAVKGKAKRKRLEDVVDAGLGYDENDPFVDNSECYDELVPSVLTTKFGGFYINSGELQFKEISGESEDSDFEVVKKRKKYQKRKKRRALESDDENQTGSKKRPLSSSSEAGNAKKKLKKKLQRHLSGGKEEKKKKKKKLNIPKAPTTIAELLKTKKGDNAASGDIRSTNGLSSQNGPNGPDEDGGLESIDPSMDIGVPNLPMDNEMAAILSDTLADWGGGGDELPDVDMANLQEGGEEGAQTEEQVQLHEGMPSMLLRDINRIKEAARKSVEGKTKFFSPAVNSLLLGIENQAREQSCGKRSAIYNHLAYHLPCTKDTLLKRAKKLRLGAQDGQLKEPLLRLREAISEVMPANIERYEEECAAAKQAKQERMEEVDQNERNGSQDEDEERTRKTRGPKGPRKKFMWTDHLRNLLCQVVSVKVTTYKIAKKRSHSAEDYIRSFLDNDIKPMWPQGWMQTRMLFKESRSVHSPITSMPTKHKKLQQFPKKLATKRTTPDGTPCGPSAPGSEENTPNNPANLSPNVSPYSENSLSPSSLLVQGAREFPTLLDYAEDPAETTALSVVEPILPRMIETPLGDRVPDQWNLSEKEKPPGGGTLQFLESAVDEVVRKLEKEKNSSDEAGDNAITMHTEVRPSTKTFTGDLSLESGGSSSCSHQHQPMRAPGTNRQLPEVPKIVAGLHSPQNTAASGNTGVPVAQTTRQPLAGPHRITQVKPHQTKVTLSGVPAVHRPSLSPQGGEQSVHRPHGGGQTMLQPEKGPRTSSGQIIQPAQKSPHSGGQTMQKPHRGSGTSVQIVQPAQKSPHVGGQTMQQPHKGSRTSVHIVKPAQKSPHVGRQIMQQPHKVSRTNVQISQPAQKSPQGGGHVIQPPVRSAHIGGAPAVQPQRASLSSGMVQRPSKSLTQFPAASQQKTQVRVGAAGNNNSRQQQPSGSSLSNLSQPLVRLTRQPSLDQMSSSSIVSKVTAKPGHASKVTVQRQGPSPKGTSPSGGAVIKRTSPGHSVVYKTKVPSGSPIKAPSPGVSPSSGKGMYPKQRHSPVDPSQLLTSPHSPKVPMAASSPTSHYPVATSGVHRVSPVRVSPSISPYPPPVSPSIYGAMHQVSRQSSGRMPSAGVQRRGSFQGVSSPMTSPTYTGSTQGIHPQAAGASRGFQQMAMDQGRKVQSTSAMFPGMSVPGLVGRSASMNELSVPPVSGASQQMVPGMEYMSGQTIDPNYDNNAQGQSRLL